MIRPVWSRPRRCTPKAIVDPAPAVLAGIAARVVSHAAETLRRRVSATHEGPIRGSWPVVHDDVSAQTWHSDEGDGLDVWCAIDGDAVRNLLEIVLGGPAAPKPTTLERGIIRETVDRLLTSGERLWEERGSPRFSLTAGWLCPILIVDAGGIRAHLDLYAPAIVEPPAPIPALVDVRDVPVSLSATLPPLAVRVDAVAAWRTGTVVTLVGAADASVGLYAGASRIAAGKLGSVRGKRALRIVVDADPAR